VGVRGADRDELHRKVTDAPADPGLPHRIAFEETEQAKAFEASDVEARGRRARTLAAGPEHVRAERFVATLRRAAPPAEVARATRVPVDGPARRIGFSGFFSMTATFT